MPIATPPPGRDPVKRLLDRGSFWIPMIVLATIAVVSLRVLAQAEPAIARRDPVSSTVNVGSTVVVNFYIQDVQNLYGADVRISFDPTILEVQDADPGAAGVQIQPLSAFLSPDFVITRKHVMSPFRRIRIA